MMVAHTQVSLERIQDEKPILDQEGFVQAKIPAHLLHLKRGGIWWHKQLKRVSRSVKNQKDDTGYHKKNDKRVIESP